MTIKEMIQHCINTRRIVQVRHSYVDQISFQFKDIGRKEIEDYLLENEISHTWSKSKDFVTFGMYFAEPIGWISIHFFIKEERGHSTNPLVKEPHGSATTKEIDDLYNDKSDRHN